MKTDLVINPFGAAMPAMVEAAQVADRAGFDGVWTLDHFSGAVLDASWSRDPFVVLGAIGSVTDRVRVGTLVANMANRHPVQLASAVNSLQSLAPGRVVLGLGSGAGPGTPWAGEHEAIGRQLPGAQARRKQLAATIGALRAIWRGDREYRASYGGFAGLSAVVDDAPVPPIIVGASGPQTAAVATEHADGINIRRTPRLSEVMAAVADRSGDASFEISVLDDLDVAHPLGGDPAELERLGADRRTLAVSPPFPLEAIAAVGNALQRAGHS